MIKCIIIDNEKITQELLTYHLSKTSYIKVLKTYDDPISALEILNSKQIDVVFCDIQMSEINGINLLKSLKTPPLFVFVTDNPSYAVESYELNVLDYILKPFEAPRLLKTIEKLLVHLNPSKDNFINQNCLVIKDRTNIVIIPYVDIFYIKADKDYINILTSEKTYNIWKKLTKMEESLFNIKYFIRIHRSYIINLEYVKRIEGNVIKMKGAIEDIPIGKQYKTDLLKRLGIWGNDY